MRLKQEIPKMNGGIVTDREIPKIPTRQPNGDPGSEVNDIREQAKIGARLKEAREYVGLLQEDIASVLSIPRASVSALESGKRRVTGLELRRLARVYRRTVGWLLGEEDIEISQAEPLFRATESLSERDREQVLRFAEFLAAAGRPAGSSRAEPSRLIPDDGGLDETDDRGN
jgi:transcriptional regulator with XRE-family HTH domain